MDDSTRPRPGDRAPQVCGSSSADQPGLANRQNRCRFCATPLQDLVINLGLLPLVNSYLESDQLAQPEALYPLRVYVCRHCYLVQLHDLQTPEHLFSNYAYFSSYSDTWLSHACKYVERVTARFQLTEESQVLEIASNDGYLLQYFVERGIPALGIEPAANVAAVAQAKGIPTRVQFFGAAVAEQLVAEGFQADLVVANNVLAHVPDLNGFVSGLRIVLKPHGVVTIEFPHLLRLLEQNQFDTIYDEHFSYFSLFTVRQILAAHGLTVFDVEELPTHGGSLRIYVRHSGHTLLHVEDAVVDLERRELAAGLASLETYRQFAQNAHRVASRLRALLVEKKQAGKQIAAYGAPAKGNVLLNFADIDSGLIDYTVDRSPHKQGRFLPGSHIPIREPDAIRQTKPDVLLILPWNLQTEIMEQTAFIRTWGGQFIVPIPDVKVCP